MENDSDEERNRVCEAFRADFEANVDDIQDRARAELLGGKVVACHCAPKRCHAETLLSLN